jgi:nucleoside-diphosphate-sugar epimerase
VNRVFVTGGSGFVGRRVLEVLRDRGIATVALARSDGSAATVTRLGAAVARGDLDDTAAMEAGMRGCDVVIHAAAHVEEHGPLAEFMRINVDGTQHALAAARAAGVARFVLISTEAVLADGKPIVQADETRRYPAGAAGPYALTKRLQEADVIAANAPGFATIAVRPRFIWGANDTSLLPGLVDRIEHGKFAWIGGGRFLTSTCHVDNVVEGALLAAERGEGGGIYFLTDGEPVEFRAFLTKLVATQNVDAGTRSVPRWLARAAATATSWMKNPPVSRLAVAIVGGEVTVVDAKARRELGYTGAMTRDRGLADMRPLR